MGACCAKGTDKPVAFSEISKNGGTEENQKKENKRYTQDPTIPRNNTATSEPQSPGLWCLMLLWITYMHIYSWETNSLVITSGRVFT